MRKVYSITGAVVPITKSNIATFLDYIECVKTIHRSFSPCKEYEFLCELSDTSVIGEAYLKAWLSYGYNMPPSSLVIKIFKKILLRADWDGQVVDWLNM